MMPWLHNVPKGAYSEICLGGGLICFFLGGLSIHWGQKKLKTIDFTDLGGGGWAPIASALNTPLCAEGMIELYL